MIRSIRLSNFQSHKETVLELVPGITAIVGESDSGKTAIIRALNWLVTNRPSGAAFQRHGTKETEVGLLVDDGILVRYRTAKSNGYRINGTDLSAIRTDVPEEVVKLLGIDPDLNMQGQLAAPFLLSMSPGEVAQTLNRIAHLDEIDTALFNVAKRLRDKGAELKAAQSQQAVLEEQHQQFAYLDQMESDVAELEQADRALEVIGLKGIQLRDLMHELVKVRSDMDMLPNVEAMAERYQEAGILHEEVVALSAKEKALRGLLNEERQLRVDSRTLPDLDGWEPLFVECEEANVQTVFQKLQLGNLIGLLEQYRMEDARLFRLAEDLDKLEESYMQQMPKVCPLCGGKVKK